MTDRPEDDLSPSLGGDRATEEPPEAPEAETRQEGPFAGGDGQPDLEALLAELGGSELGEVLRRLGPLLGGVRGGAGPEAAEVEELIARFEPFSQEVGAIMEDTLRLVEERLPPTLAAFEGMFSALGQVFQPLFEEPDDPSDRQA